MPESQTQNILSIEFPNLYTAVFPEDFSENDIKIYQKSIEKYDSLTLEEQIIQEKNNKEITKLSDQLAKAVKYYYTTDDGIRQEV